MNMGDYRHYMSNNNSARDFHHYMLRPPITMPWFPHDVTDVFRDPYPHPVPPHPNPHGGMRLNLTSGFTPPPPSHTLLNIPHPTSTSGAANNMNRKRPQQHQYQNKAPQQAKRRRQDARSSHSVSNPIVVDDNIIELTDDSVDNRTPQTSASTNGTVTTTTNRREESQHYANRPAQNSSRFRGAQTDPNQHAIPVNSTNTETRGAKNPEPPHQSSNNTNQQLITSSSSGSSSSSSRNQQPITSSNGAELRPLYNDAVSLPRKHLSPVDRLTEQVHNYFNLRKQQPSDLTRKVEFLRLIRQESDSLYEGSKLFIVGSSMNGFGSRDSDMDVCLLLGDKTNLRQKADVLPMLRKLAKRFKKHRNMKNIFVIPATVPIIKFDIGSYNPVEVDLNIDNTVSIRNTHLLSAYSQLDQRLAPLVFAVKYLARALHINDAKEGTLSSYSLALMTLNYLQVGCDPPVIPSLQEAHKFLFARSNHIKNLPETPEHVFSSFTSRNTQSTGDLLLGFCHYYGFSFNFARDIMSVSGATAYPRAFQGEAREWRNKRICIEEPFEQTNTARAVWSGDKYQQIVTMIRFAYNFLVRTHDFNKLLGDNPLLEYPIS